MNEKIAKITDTFLGYEDHGIFTAMLTVDYGGSCQGIGGYGMDQPARPSPDGQRNGTAFGCEFIMRVLGACGVGSWEEVKGRTIMVRLADDSWSAKVVGIGPLPTEPGKWFMFDELREKYYPG